MVGNKCPFINFAFGRPVSPILGNNSAQGVEIVFQVCQCVRHDCVFWHEQKESCKIELLADAAIAMFAHDGNKSTQEFQAGATE